MTDLQKLGIAGGVHMRLSKERLRDVNKLEGKEEKVLLIKR